MEFVKSKHVRASNLDSTLQEIVDLTLKANDPNYVPVNQEEEEALDSIREGYAAVILETEEPKTAYSRASTLRKRANLPGDGQWIFTGSKFEDQDGVERGVVSARFVPSNN